MSFLTIPSQENLFTTVRGRAADGADRVRSVDAEEEDDDDEDDTDVRLIPRCSPVPRKRGSSIADETEEYLRIQRALSEGKRVSFADTTGRDLVDVKEFTAFDSDEEDGGKWEEEQAKYRLSQGEPVFHVQPEFSVRSGGDLLQAVRKNKVEVENISVVEDEPLAVSGVIRVLNISFNKAVYVRCTMDSWSSYYDHPADYVQGSHDGDTDQFCFKLCFASPYTTHGSRMEFVVRYETSEGDYWANNSNMNYVLTLLLSYEDKSSETHTELRDVRSILKPPKTHRTEINFESEDEPNDTEGEQEDSTRSGLVRPEAIRPVVFQPELDVELTEVHSSPAVPHDDGTESTHCETAQSLCPVPSLPHETRLAHVLQASAVLPPHESEQPDPPAPGPPEPEQPDPGRPPRPP
ncbi:hypothetical protein NQD34_005653 [Periophthalmus magnuspinnatus]|nr:hypothetical protein NQD34_005653 [Periophthalmus magnuspinnatus]